MATCCALLLREKLNAEQNCSPQSVVLLSSGSYAAVPQRSSHFRSSYNKKPMWRFLSSAKLGGTNYCKPITACLSRRSHAAATSGRVRMSWKSQLPGSRHQLDNIDSYSASPSDRDGIFWQFPLDTTCRLADLLKLLSSVAMGSQTTALY